ncbi:MAG TPA: nucleoside recognition domain-containing protein [Myxococcaceae bacterium]|nr:nucleoside recognition domain-containing protein [Myxococcaceae bacterium]
MLNGIFLVLIAGSVLTAAFRGTMPRVTEASLTAAKASVDLALGLVGQMALWLGMMAIVREGGLLRSIARGLRPLMRRIFPEVPDDHPAMGSMILNLAANMLGLGNAATPFGLKAMTELNTLNRYPGVATNSMALFLSINAAGVAILPLGAVAVRAALGSKDPAGIVLPSFLSTFSAAFTAVVVAKLLENKARFRPERYTPEPGKESTAATKGPDAAALEKAEQLAVDHAPASPRRRAIALGLLVLFLVALVREALRIRAEHPGFDWVRVLMSEWTLPTIMLAIVLFGLARHVKVYEVFISGAKEGFQIAIVIIPFLVAILVGIAMFRASGAMDTLIGVLSPVTSRLGFPAEALPMALIKPLSGSGALGVMSETMKTYGPDSFIGYLVCLLNAGTETTFYVLAVYFGSVQVRVMRHTLVACLSADLAGYVAATSLCYLFFGWAPR